MNTQDQSQLERMEADAWADLCRGASKEFQSTYGVAVSPIGGSMVARVSAIDHPSLNRVVGLGVFEPMTQASVAEIASYFVWHGVRNFHLQMVPFAKPDTYQQMLAEGGFVKQGGWYKVYHDLKGDLGKGTGPEVVMIAPDQARLYAQIVVGAFGMPEFLQDFVSGTVGRPGWRHYLTISEKGEAMGTGALYIKNGAAWAGMAGTLPAHRGQGSQTALLARRLRDAKELGCSVVVSETEQPESGRSLSYDNLLRAGFRLAYLRENYGRTS